MNASSQNPQRHIQNLEKVLSVNAKINSTLDLDELLAIIMNTASEVMETEAASLMLLDDEKQELVFKVALGEKGKELQEKFRVKIGEGIAGHVAETGKSVIVNDPLNDRRFARRFDESTGFTTRAIACVPMTHKSKIIGILQAINPRAREGFSDEDLRLFESFAEQSALSVENARLHAVLVKQEKARQELQIAHEIQQNFLPLLKPGAFPVDIAARSLPAQEVGGDFFDVINLDDSRLGIMIGDVSGKGVPAALYMVRAITEYRFLAAQHKNPASLLQALNRVLTGKSSFGMFVTLLYVVINHREKTIEYSSAGHLPLLYRSPDAPPSFLEHAGGMPLGLSEEVDYPQIKFQVGSGDALFLYTDGITEARNPEKKEYGADRLKLFAGNKHSNARDYAESLLTELNHFTRGAPQHDDLTALVVIIP